MQLTDLAIGEKAVVQHFNNPQLEAVLTDMGCPSGTLIEVYHKALFNGPISIKTADGCILALRTSDASQLHISQP